MSSLAEFRARVRAEHREAFALHHHVAVLLEDALGRPRPHLNALQLAVDMLMVQAYKAHLSASILSEHGHIEDTATIARRLLELAAQALYIGGDEEDSVRQERATRYVADLWDNLPEKHRAELPSDIQAEWKKLADAAGPLPAGRSRWGPTFRQMFEYAGLEMTYDQDYRFLSGVAHGSPDTQILQYSMSPVPVRSTRFAGVLVVYSSRYYLTVAEQWNRVFALFDPSEIEDLTRRLDAWHS